VLALTLETQWLGLGRVGVSLLLRLVEVPPSKYPRTPYISWN